MRLRYFASVEDAIPRCPNCRPIAMPRFITSWATGFLSQSCSYGKPLGSKDLAIFESGFRLLMSDVCTLPKITNLSSLILHFRYFPEKTDAVTWLIYSSLRTSIREGSRSRSRSKSRSKRKYSTGLWLANIWRYKGKRGLRIKEKDL